MLLDKAKKKSVHKIVLGIKGMDRVRHVVCDVGVKAAELRRSVAKARNTNVHNSIIYY